MTFYTVTFYDEQGNVMFHQLRSVGGDEQGAMSIAFDEQEFGPNPETVRPLICNVAHLH